MGTIFGSLVKSRDMTWDDIVRSWDVDILGELLILVCEEGNRRRYWSLKTFGKIKRSAWAVIRGLSRKFFCYYMYLSDNVVQSVRNEIFFAFQ